MTQQIWKDYYVDLSAYLTDGAAVYEIRKGADTLYTGRAVQRPDGTCRVRVNDVCAAWLGSHLPDVETQGDEGDDSLVAFAVYVGGSKVEDVVLYRDWSYDRNWNPYTGGVSTVPIRRIADTRMPILCSFLKSDTITVDVRGTSTSESVTAPCVYVVPATGAAGTVSIGSLTWDVKDTCRRWALYYVNKYSGWDSFIFADGTESEGYARDTVERDYDNNDELAVGTLNYRTERSRSWELRTGILTDAEAAQMDTIAGAVQAYLYDMQEGVWYPVTMADASWTRRRYAQGRQRVEYTITCRLAQEEVRR